MNGEAKPTHRLDSRLSISSQAEPAGSLFRPEEASQHRSLASHAGFLIVNADDWGRDRLTTERTLECVRRKAVSSVSAMVFMEDSERAAAIAREHAIEAGLHLNLTASFSAPSGSRILIECQQKIARYLL